MESTHEKELHEAVDTASNNAALDFNRFKKTSVQQRAKFLRGIADEIEALGTELVQKVMVETNLPEARVVGERARTVGHCRMFADLIEEGSWLDARIDTAQPERTPLPKPDIRKMLMPIGPVVVFGAANFPLAYSTAGGDTISALAAGCPVIVKAHPAHLGTSKLVARAMQNAVVKCEMPPNVFQHLDSSDNSLGKMLVEHSAIKAVGFTGSLAVGRTLFDIANKRQEPIPVFAEMSSTNPVVIFPESLNNGFEATAKQLAASMTLGVGQFCTAPGIIIAIDNDALKLFIKVLGQEIQKVIPARMLHSGIAENYHRRLNDTLRQNGVQVEAKSEQAGLDGTGESCLASVTSEVFLKNKELWAEVFGPFALIVKCTSMNEVQNVISSMHGQLTTTLIGDIQEITKYTRLIDVVNEKAGRIIFNGVPTGVEVCPSMMHGGPYPATTDSRFTAVGQDAIKRFVRPVAFQNFPDDLLPDELKNNNPRNIWRLVNNQLTKASI